MRINGIWMRTIFKTSEAVRVIDQRVLPHQLAFIDLRTRFDAAEAIRNMTVRGAGLIGATAAWGMALAARNAAGLPLKAFEEAISDAAEALVATRPTASNLAFAVRRMQQAMSRYGSVAEKVLAAELVAQGIADEDAAFCRRIGMHGLALLRRIHEAKAAKGCDPTVHVLTHCNAGWLAFTDFGSALAPVYAAAAAGIPVHVWVDETRPRMQGASLTAYELAAAGIPHDLVTDNTGGHLMQHGMVDIVIVGADRVTRCGDAANKIGTYLKALAAMDNGIPFHVALPSSTIDWTMHDGVAEIPVEERGAEEVRYVCGRLGNGRTDRVLICPDVTPARNFAFDVTPARLITGLVTERGLCPATEAGLQNLYHETDDTEGSQEHRAAIADGVVKFRADFAALPLPPEIQALALRLDTIRRPLRRLGMIGESNGIGHGNISSRISAQFGQFIITGTATGRFEMLSPEHFSVVEAAVHSENRVMAYGGTAPSSESMTHAALYMADSTIGGVVHVHNLSLFDHLIACGQASTPAHVEYGTPAMAQAVASLARTMPGRGLFVTPGHQDGVFAYSKDAGEAASIILEAAGTARA